MGFKLLISISRRAFLESLSNAKLNFYSFFAGDLDKGFSRDFNYNIAKEGTLNWNSELLFRRLVKRHFLF